MAEAPCPGSDPGAEAGQAPSGGRAEAMSGSSDIARLPDTRDATTPRADRRDSTEPRCFGLKTLPGLNFHVPQHVVQT